MHVVPILWIVGILMVFGGMYQDDSLVSTCGTMCSKARNCQSRPLCSL